MNNEELMVIGIINEKSTFKPNFRNIENKIDLPSKRKNLIFNILLGCESLAFMYSLIMIIMVQLKPVGEGGENKINTLYLLAAISFLFILIITFILKFLINKNLKKGGK